MILYVEYADELAWRAWWLDHALRHQVYAGNLFARYATQDLNFDLMNQIALTNLLDEMRDPDTQRMQPLDDWLQQHDAMHAVELQALGQGSTIGVISTVDFKDREQYFDWMQIHQNLHDLEDVKLT